MPSCPSNVPTKWSGLRSTRRVSRRRRFQRGLRTSSGFPTASRRVGLTLMEVVVGLALMASLLVGALLAFSAHQKQLRRAEQQLAAVSIADELLNELSGRQEGIPKSGRGPVAKMTGWFWQTRVVGLASPAQVPLQVIRLDIVEIQIDGTLKIMTSVDVVEPIL